MDKNELKDLEKEVQEEVVDESFDVEVNEQNPAITIRIS